MKNQIKKIQENYPETLVATSWDFAQPFPDEAPEFVLLGDDYGKMWEFVDGKLVRSVTVGDMMDPLKIELALAGEGAPAGKLLKSKIDSGEIWNYPCKGFALSSGEF